jgi:phage baseplate assembly protein W
MAIQRKSRAFKDISLTFSPHPVTKDLPVLVNERAVIRSVRNLVETIPTERFFNPILGTDIRDTLFDNYDRMNVMMIEDQIRETLSNFEPRVSNVGATVKARPDDNVLDINVFFDINGLDIPTQSFSFILEPTR